MLAVSDDLQKDTWEGVDKRRPVDQPAVRAFARAKLDLVLAAGTTMLEVGAGNGYFSITFQSAFELSCADFSANMLGINPLPNRRKIVADAQRLPFRDDSFEVAFCGNLLHHFESPVTAVKEMARVASRHVVLVEPNALNPLMFLFGALVKEERGMLRFTPGYLRRLAGSAGLGVRRLVSQGAILPNKTPAWALSFLKAFDGVWPLGFYHIAVLDI